MRILRVHWKTVLFILIGISILCLCQFTSFGTVRHEVLRKFLGWKDVPCWPNGTRACMPYEHTVNLSGDDQETVPRKETKALTKYNGKTFNFLEKLTKHKKVDFVAEQTKIAYPKSEKDKIKKVEIRTEDLIDSWPQVLLHSDTFDMAEFEDSNISEEASLDIATLIPKDTEGKPSSLLTKDFSKSADIEKKRRRPGRNIPTRKPSIPQAVMTPPFPEPQTCFGQHEPHPPHPEIVLTTISHWPTVHVIFSYMVGGFLATILAILSALLADSILSYVKTCCKTPEVYKSLNDTKQPEIEINSECNLDKLPLDLLEMLMKKLDVCRQGELFYGWQRLGAEFKVHIDDLRFLELEYKRDNGSPTIKLLEMLGATDNKTISDLVRVLESPKVNRFDITSLIKLV